MGTVERRTWWKGTETRPLFWEGIVSQLIKPPLKKKKIVQAIYSQRNITSSNIRRKQTRKSHQFQIISRAQFRAMENSQSPQNEASE